MNADVDIPIAVWRAQINVLARVYGCESCLAGELLEFADGTLGLALNLESQSVGVVRFAKPMGDNNTCVEGSIVRTTRSVANISVGPFGWHGRVDSE